MQLTPSTRAGYQPFWPEDHDHDQQGTEDQVANIRESEAGYKVGYTNLYPIKDTAWIAELRRQKHIESIDYQRTNDHTGNTADTTNDYHCEKDDGIAKTKVIRRNLTQLGGMKSSRDAREKRAHGKSK